MNIIQSASPNFKKPAKLRKITALILHATATKGASSPLQWLCSPLSKVSAHYIVGTDGTVWQLVDEKNIAWHAGVSEYKGQSNVNNFSIGIEMVNPNDGHTDYPQPQFDACAELCADICIKYGIAPQDVVGHLHVAPTRKTDPAGFDFDEFRMRLTDLGVKSKVNA